MSVTGIGSKGSYLYHTKTNKPVSKSGGDDAFVKWFSGELTQEELPGKKSPVVSSGAYQAARKWYEEQLCTPISQLNNGGGNADAYKKYLESKYGRVTIKDVPKDQKTLEKLGKSMSGNDVVIAPGILEEMANDPEKAAYYEQKIDYYFNTIIPRETAFCAARGLVFEPAGVVVHKDGTVTYICGCSDSPERVAQVKAINKARDEKRAAQRKAAFERGQEAAVRQREAIWEAAADRLTQSYQSEYTGLYIRTDGMD